MAYVCVLVKMCWSFLAHRKTFCHNPDLVVVHQQKGLEVWLTRTSAVIFCGDGRAGLFSFSKTKYSVEVHLLKMHESIAHLVIEMTDFSGHLHSHTHTHTHTHKHTHMLSLHLC